MTNKRVTNKRGLKWHMKYYIFPKKIYFCLGLIINLRLWENLDQADK